MTRPPGRRGGAGKRPKRVRARRGRKVTDGCLSVFLLTVMFASPWLVLGALVVGAR